MTKKEVKEILLREYSRALKSIEESKEAHEWYEEYRSGVNYFMGWISNDFNISMEEMSEARKKDL